MECARARRLMPLSVGGDVTAATREAVLAHAEACPACRAELASYRRAAEALEVFRDVPEPRGGWEGLRADILRALPAPGARRPALRPRALRAARFAAALLLGFLVGLLVNPYRPSPPAGGGAPSFYAPASAPPSAPGSAPLLRTSWRDHVGAIIGRSAAAEGGWQVREVLPGRPADRSGLRADDILQSIDGADLPSSLDGMAALLSHLLERDEIRLRVLRGGIESDVILRLRRE
jgi:hypothetical protein